MKKIVHLLHPLLDGVARVARPLLNSRIMCVVRRVLSKYADAITNTFLLFLGISLVGVDIWVCFNVVYPHFFSSNITAVSAGILAGISVGVLLVGALGASLVGYAIERGLFD